MSQIFDSKIKPVSNYAMPGLDSYLISEGPDGSKLRAFHATRDFILPITPHSHRFDLDCFVMQGEVENRLWTPDPDGDLFSVNEQVCKSMGEYQLKEVAQKRFMADETFYCADDHYAMAADEIHSIAFGKDAVVLIRESEPKVLTSVVLLPVLDNGTVVNTLEVKDWMFKA